MDEESRVIELIDWLEKAAHDTDAGTLFRRIREKTTVITALGINWSRVVESGKLELSFRIPVNDLVQKNVISHSEVSVLKEFLGTIPVSEIAVNCENDENNEEVIVLHRFEYIPKEIRHGAVRIIERKFDEAFMEIKERLVKDLPELTEHQVSLLPPELGQAYRELRCVE